MRKRKYVEKETNLIESAWNPKETVIIKTEITPIDILLDGGIELGSKIMLLGDSGIGKSTITLQICEKICSQGYKVLYVDTENSVSESLVNNIGLSSYINNLEEKEGGVFIHKASSYLEVEKIIDKYLNSKETKISIVIIDSFAGLVNDCYTNIGEKHQSCINSNTNFESRPATIFMSKYSALASKYKVAFIYTNQYRMKVGFVGNQNLSTLKEYGPKAVRYNIDTLLKISKHTDKKDEEKVEFDDSVRLDFKVDKSNKLKPNTINTCYLEYGYGINEVMQFITDLIRNNIIYKNTSYYTITVDKTEHKFKGIKELYIYICQEYDYIKSIIEVSQSKYSESQDEFDESKIELENSND